MPGPCHVWDVPRACTATAGGTAHAGSRTPLVGHTGAVSFAGRSIPDPGFGGDPGTADAALAAALASFSVHPGRAPEVLYALGSARVLVPVVAVATEQDTPAGGMRREKSTDMALVTVQRTDGARALPAFSSLETLAAWRPDARPVPVEAARAALSAAAEGAVALLLDPAGPVSFPVTGPALRGLAEGTLMPPLYSDPGMLVLLQEVAAAHIGIRRLRLEPAQGSDARVVLTVARAADPVPTVQPFAEALQQLDALRARSIYGLDIAVEQSA